MQARKHMNCFSLSRWFGPKAIEESECRRVLDVDGNLNTCTKMIESSNMVRHRMMKSGTIDEQYIKAGGTGQILIIGSGVCALWFSMHLKRCDPSCNILILENRTAPYDTQYVNLEMNVFDTYVEFPAKTTTMRLGDLREMMIEYIEMNIDGIRIIDNVKNISLKGIPHKALIVADGACGIFASGIFNEVLDVNHTYYVQLEYDTQHEPFGNIQREMNVQQMYSKNHVILRTEMPFQYYVIDTYKSIPQDERERLNYIINKRAASGKEQIILSTVRVSTFRFPIYARQNFAVLRTVPCFALGAAAFQLSLENGLSHALNLCTQLAPLFIKDVVTIVGEYNYMCSSFVAARQPSVPSAQPATSTNEEWKQDIF